MLKFAEIRIISISTFRSYCRLLQYLDLFMKNIRKPISLIMIVVIVVLINYSHCGRTDYKTALDFMRLKSFGSKYQHITSNKTTVPKKTQDLSFIEMIKFLKHLIVMNRRIKDSRNDQKPKPWHRIPFLRKGWPLETLQ